MPGRPRIVAPTIARLPLVAAVPAAGSLQARARAEAAQVSAAPFIVESPLLATTVSRRVHGRHTRSTPPGEEGYSMWSWPRRCVSAVTSIATILPLVIVKVMTVAQDPAVTSHYLHPDHQAVLDVGAAYTRWWAQSGPNSPALRLVEDGPVAG